MNIFIYKKKKINFLTIYNLILENEFTVNQNFSSTHLKNIITNIDIFKVIDKY